MADWNTPINTTAYDNVLAFLKDRDTDIAKMFDGTTSSNIPTGTVKYLSASAKFQKFNGSSWDDQAISISGGGTGASSASGARSNLGLGDMAVQSASSVAITGGSMTDIATFSARASGFTIKDNADATKIMKFNLASMTSGVTRTLVPPNADTTLVGTDTAQTLTNKTLTDAIANTQAVGDSSTKVATTAFVNSAIPAGVIMAWPTNSAPSGWLLCYGQAVSRSTYPALFALIGTTFGSGDGSTTFNVPDLRGLVIVGADNMGGSQRNVLDGTVSRNTIGAVLGSQYHGHSATISGSTAGSLTVNTTSYAMDGANVGFTASAVGGAQNVAHINHTHANVLSSGATSGALSVSGSATVANGSGLQPGMILYYIIKAA